MTTERMTALASCERSKPARPEIATSPSLFDGDHSGADPAKLVTAGNRSGGPGEDNATSKPKQAGRSWWPRANAASRKLGPAHWVNPSQRVGHPRGPSNRRSTDRRQPAHNAGRQWNAGPVRKGPDSAIPSPSAGRPMFPGAAPERSGGCRTILLDHWADAGRYSGPSQQARLLRSASIRVVSRTDLWTFPIGRCASLGDRRPGGQRTPAGPERSRRVAAKTAVQDDIAPLDVPQLGVA